MPVPLRAAPLRAPMPRASTLRASTLRALAASLALLAAATAITTTAALAQEVRPVRISVDRAKVVRIPRAADTVVIGNPGIVDATLQDATTIVLTGRMAGETNIIVLDEAGDPIVDETVVVGPPLNATIRVYAGTSQRSYACAPACARVLDAGDDAASTSALLTGIGAKTSTAEPK